MKKPTISKKQERFFAEFFKTITLKDLLPLYVNAVSKSPHTFHLLPENMINPAINSLIQIQSAVGQALELVKQDFNNEDILRNLRILDSEVLLNKYVTTLTGAEESYLLISEELRLEAIWRLEEIRLSVTGENGFFSDDFDIEKMYFDGFIEYAGGRRIETILGSDLPPGVDNADYYFRRDNVIIELKILKTDFLEKNISKLNAIRDKFLKTTKITPGMILGTDTSIPREMFDAQVRVLRDAMVPITKKANRQFKDSKTLLGEPDAKGIVIYLIDGFYSLNLYLIIESLFEPITRQFSAIDGQIFLNLRRLVRLNLGDGPFKYFVFEKRMKNSNDEQLYDFIKSLGFRWRQYPEILTGNRLGKHVLSIDNRNLIGADWV